VYEISAADRRFPPKSTYFHPKVPSGLVMRTMR